MEKNSVNSEVIFISVITGKSTHWPFNFSLALIVFMAPKSGNISQFPPFMRCVNHSYISAVCPSCWQLNVLNEKLRTLSTAVVFAVGSKLYRKPPPEGNILNQVVKCIWVSSWIVCLPFSITRKEMLFWAYRPSNMGIHFSQWPLHCFCDFWKVGLIKLHLMPLFNLYLKII